MLIAWGITLVYTMIGGMWSVTLTESVQIVIALTGLVLLAGATFSQFGDGSVFAGVERLITESDPAALTLVPPLATAAILSYLGAWGTGIFGNIPGQDMQQRIFSARDEKTAVRACHLTGVTYFCFGMLPVGLGLVSRIVMPDAPDTGILQLMVSRYLSPAMSVFFMLSFTSMVISTSTSAILAPATILSHSLLGRIAVFRRQGLLLDRGSVFLISLGGLALTFLNQSKMQLLDLAISMTLVALFIPLWLGLYGRPRSEWSAILAMALGISCFFIRWLPENMLLVQPEEVRIVTGDQFESVEYNDYVAWERIDGFRFPRIGSENSPGSTDNLPDTVLQRLSSSAGIVRGLLMIPADWYGVVASCFGYLIGQALFRKQAPINLQTRRDAWGAATGGIV